MSAPRAYAVGRLFSVRDVDGTDDYAWRPTDRYWTDVEYRRPRPRPQRTSRTATVRRRVDPSAIRTPAEQKAAGRRVC